MIETGPHNYALKQFSKEVSLDQTTKEIKLTSVKSKTFQSQCTISKDLPLATCQCENKKIKEILKRKQDDFTKIRP